VKHHHKRIYEPGAAHLSRTMQFFGQLLNLSGINQPAAKMKNNFVVLISKK